MTPDEQEFLNGIREAKRRGQGEYLSIVALTVFLLEKQGGTAPSLRQELQRATRGELKRAIKSMREVQRGYKWPEYIDGTVSLIRRDFLHRGDKA